METLIIIGIAVAVAAVGLLINGASGKQKVPANLSSQARAPTPSVKASAKPVEKPAQTYSYMGVEWEAIGKDHIGYLGDANEIFSNWKRSSKKHLYYIPTAYYIVKGMPGYDVEMIRRKSWWYRGHANPVKATVHEAGKRTLEGHKLRKSEKRYYLLISYRETDEQVMLVEFRKGGRHGK